MTGRAAPAPWRYWLNGLCLSSNVELGTLRPHDSASGPWLHFELTGSAAPPHLPAAQATYTVAAEGRNTPFITVAEQSNTYLLRIHGYGDFFVDRQGLKISCTPAPDCRRATIEQLLVDQVIPHVMQLRGQPCLHGSAAAFQRRAVGFVGPAGSGKSTITAALCARGATLVADDCLALAASDDLVQVHPGYASVRLWPDSARALFDDPSAFPLASPRSSKLRVERQIPDGSPVLAALFVLSAANPIDRPEAVRITGTHAFSVLASTVHRIAYDHPDAMAAELALLTHVVARVPIMRLAVPRRFDALDDTLTIIEDSLQG